MKLSDILNEDKIVLDFKAKDKEKVFDILLEPLNSGFDKKSLLDAVLEREELGSTGVGEGIAIPHVRLDSISEPVLVFGRSKKPIDFDSIDDEPCTFFFLVLASSKNEAQELYLGILAKISRLLRNQGLREELKGAGSAANVIEIIRNAES